MSVGIRPHALEPPPGPAPSGHRASTAPIAAAGALALGAALLLWATRDLTYLMDEWDLIQYHWPATLDAFFMPHNQHLIVIQVLLFKLFAATFGLDHYLPYRLVLIAVHVVCVVLLLIIVRRRLGPALALPAVLPIIFLGSAWFTVLNPFNDLWIISAASFLGMVLMLDAGTRGHDAGAAGLLLVCYASSSFGPAAAVGVLARILLEPNRLRRLWIVVAPSACYLLWYVAYGADAGKAPGWHATVSPLYVWHLAANAVAGWLGAPLGFDGLPLRRLVLPGMHLLTLLLVAGVVLQLSRVGRVRPPAAMALAALVAYWLTLMVGRGWEGRPYATHYVYIGAVLLVLVAVELFAGLRAPVQVAVGVAAVACLAAIANTAVLLHFSAKRRHDADVVRAQVGALELARAAVPATFKVNDEDDQAPSLYAGPYFQGTRAAGSSPAPGAAGIAAAGEDARAAADALLVRAFGLAPRPASAGVTRLLAAAGVLGKEPVHLEQSSNAVVRMRGGCVSARPARGALAAIDLRLPPAAATALTARGGEAQVRVRRFATGFPQAPAGSVRGRAYVLTRRDAAPQRWRLRVSSSGPVHVC